MSIVSDLFLYASIHIIISLFMLFCSVSDRDNTPSIGEEFCQNPIVKKISFTGSTAVGKALMKLSSDTVKRLSLGKY